jgi:hypothetical protein
MLYAKIFTPETGGLVCQFQHPTIRVLGFMPFAQVKSKINLLFSAIDLKFIRPKLEIPFVY